MAKKACTKVKIDYAECIVEGCLKQIRDQSDSSVLTLVAAWSIKIKPQTSPKVLGLIRDLSVDDPVPLQHIKRLQKHDKYELTVVPCSVQMMTAEELTAKLEERGIEYSAMEKKEVPKHCPPTKELALKWGSISWPLVWKGNPNDQILAEMEFDMAQIRLSLKLISEASQKVSSDGSGNLPVTTAIVDPQTNKIMSIFSDNRHSHPLDHSIMHCINVVSEEEQKGRQGKDPSEYNYLCNGYHVYTTHEPCTMCSMALIHSRVSRLVYLKRSPVTGALHPQSGEGYMVHNHELLNSKFEVFEWLGDEFLTPSIENHINA